jgi:hypothetical protein
VRRWEMMKGDGGGGQRAVLTAWAWDVMPIQDMSAPPDFCRRISAEYIHPYPQFNFVLTANTKTHTRTEKSKSVEKMLSILYGQSQI